MVIHVPYVPVRPQMEKECGVFWVEGGMCTQEPKREEQQQESVATEGRRSTRKKQATRVYGRDGVDARSDKVENSPRSLQHFSAVLLLFGDGVSKG